MSAAGPQPIAGPPSAVIEQIAALGAFFAWEARPAPGTEPAPSPSDARDLDWQPLSAPLLAARVEAVREWLAAAGGQPAEAVETRVAASVAHLGLAARLVSPALAAAVLAHRPLVFPLSEVRWRPVLGGPVPLALPVGALGPACRSAEDLAELLAARLMAGALAELAAAFGPFGVSRHILRGNTASAVGGAAVTLAARRPERATSTRAFAGLLLGRAPLAGASSTEGGALRRRSCCLIYRAAPGRDGPLCGDCALAPRSPARGVPDSAS
ncbi:hypothetical protein [Streptomyces sp. NBC_01190]|uniref:hypothetical protein n=1 Tax=Streptomyces sp. NBC_01190 TaxID=2903767 RepID=UPI003869C3E4|nr:(2Fe-2S)-binding protein [Streptomyces sp. NBC_01190]